MSEASKRNRPIAIQIGRCAVFAFLLPATLLSSANHILAQAATTPSTNDARAASPDGVAFTKLLVEANAHVGAGKFAEASDVGRRAIEHFRKVVPESTQQKLIVVAWLAEIEERAERWTEALALREEIVAGLTKLHGAENWQTADARRAIVYTNRLRALKPDERLELHHAAQLTLPYTRESPAETLKKAEQALEIRRRLLGTKNTLYAASLNYVGLQRFLAGDYARAEPDYLEAREVYRQIVGDNHPTYAYVLYNLAMFYHATGDGFRTAALYVEAIAIMKRTYGPNHRHTAVTLLAFARALYQAGEVARAETTALEAREIFRRTQSEFSPDFAAAQFFLGLLYCERGEFEKAEPILNQVREVYRTTVGERDYQYAKCLSGLGHLRFGQRRFAECETLYREALEIDKASLGEKHPEYGAGLMQLAFLHAQRGDAAKAEPLYREALAISRDSLEATSVLQSERQQLSMGLSLRFQLDNYVSLGVNSGRYAREIFADVLTWKGATLVRQRGLRLAADDPTVAATFAKLQQTVGRLSSLSRAVPDAAEQLLWRAQVFELGAEKEKLEAELSAKSAAFRQATKEVTLDDLLAALPKDAVLVDYLEYRRALPVENDAASKEPAKWNAPRYQRQYVAFVVRHAEKADEQVAMIPLGPSEPLGAAIDAWRKTFGMDPTAAQAGAQLRTALWEPLLKSIAGAKTILVSTNGALGRLPLGALPGREPGKYLLEDHRLAMLPVPQLLPTLVNAAGKRAVSHELLLLGDVDYDATGKPDDKPAKRKQPRRAGDDRGTDPHRSPADNKLFDPLANTAGEIASIRSLYAELFETKPDDPLSLARREAGETRFRELAARYRHLHLATHGFFAGAEHTSALDPASTSNDRGRAQLVGRESPLVGMSPGLLSGLALAGANREPTVAADDGILTSQEISALDLSGVDTVVLSACDTGLGATAGGEGLLGVQRAFQTAGARTTVASYWKVDDLVTRLLMERFYRNLWDKEMTRLDALREAQLYVLDHPEALRGGDAPRETTERTSPRLWAAFSLSGDWR